MYIHPIAMCQQAFEKNCTSVAKIYIIVQLLFKSFLTQVFPEILSLVRTSHNKPHRSLYTMHT